MGIIIVIFHGFIHQHWLSACCVPRAVLGTEDEAGNKKSKISALMELMIQWGRQMVRCGMFGVPSPVAVSLGSAMLGEQGRARGGQA